MSCGTEMGKAWPIKEECYMAPIGERVMARCGLGGPVRALALPQIPWESLAPSGGLRTASWVRLCPLGQRLIWT